MIQNLLSEAHFRLNAIHLMSLGQSVMDISCLDTIVGFTSSYRMIDVHRVASPWLHSQRHSASAYSIVRLPF